jgi:hypothetical protein
LFLDASTLHKAVWLARDDRGRKRLATLQALKTFNKSTRAMKWTAACSHAAHPPWPILTTDCCSEDSEKSPRGNTVVNPTTNTVDDMNVALGVLVLLTSFIAGTEPRDGSHVRTMDKRLRNAIDEGLARSDLFRGLIARLDGSDVIVYIEPECPMSSRLFGRLRLLGAGGDRRYVNVRISCMLTVTQQIAALGHELRHAVEIADAPSVVDDASLAAEYHRVGFASRVMRRGDGYESRAAIDAAQQVWAELAHTAE